MSFRLLCRVMASFGLAVMLGYAAWAGTSMAQESTPSSALHECEQPAAKPDATPIDKDRIIATVTAEEKDTGVDAVADPEADPQADPEADPQADPEADPVAGSGVLSDEVPVCSVIVEMVDIDFSPNEFTIPADQPVRLVFPNDGFLPHDFTLDEPGLDVDVASGNTATVVVNIPAGDYDFFCEQAGHAQAGMVGVMHVVAEP